MIKIIQNKTEEHNNFLRQICEPVKQKEFGTVELKEIIQKMRDATRQDSDGVAIAAPQIQVSKRIFTIDPERGYDKNAKWKPEVFINPEIVKYSTKQELRHEGCLSVRGIYGDAWRCINVTVNAYDENGNKFTFGAGGLTANIIQHEMDHLDGILFIDHGENLVDDPNWQDHWKNN